jgi:hypothetical protein
MDIIDFKRDFRLEEQQSFYMPELRQPLIYTCVPNLAHSLIILWGSDDLLLRMVSWKFLNILSVIFQVFLHII